MPRRAPIERSALLIGCFRAGRSDSKRRRRRKERSAPAHLSSHEGLIQSIRTGCAHLGGEPPAHLPRWLLMRVLAYRLQADTFGGLHKSIQRTLRSDKDRGAAMPFDRRAPQTRDGVGLTAGALLAREWNGKLERVMILEEGFAWNGQAFGSLSQIAKAITGTNWNGHRFFGLRQGKAAVRHKDRSRRSGGGRATATAAQDATSGDAP